MLSIVVFGASGDLAKRKTFPALFGLFRNDFLPAHVQIIGYARTQMTRGEFHGRLMPFLNKRVSGDRKSGEKLEEFLQLCDYTNGPYDRPDGVEKVRNAIIQAEAKCRTNKDEAKHVRLFYMALPPSVFVDVARQIHAVLCSGEDFEVRLVVEKPFGKDSQSSMELAAALSPLFSETETYRIDHYLGKEMIKNIQILRFANMFFDSVWNRDCISSVQIVFKEKLGIEGRGGYFDEFGVIRDVMQNHLMQMLAVVAMERPASLDSEDVRDAKVKLLQCIRPLALDDVVLGQYGPSEDGKNVGYLDDESVPAASNAPTFALAVLNIDNGRWKDVPFILRCGKALNEQKTEIRIQFRKAPAQLFDMEKIARNELVIRVQPDEAVYMKMMVKRPGLATEPIVSDLDLSYSRRYSDLHIPDAYESLILDILRGDHSNFVRADELQCAWDVFTPILHRIDHERIRPIVYPYGSRGPQKADEYIAKTGYVRSQQDDYRWPTQKL